MSLLHRVTALLVALSFAQLTLAETLAQCGTRGQLSRAGAHAGSPLGAIVMAHEMVGDESDAIGSRCAATDLSREHMPCSLPLSAGGCSTMVSCTTTTIAESVTPFQWTTDAILVSSAVTVSLPNPTSAPELPPPRA